MIFSQILSTLSQTYTLRIPRDDIAVPQHNKRLESRTNSSYLAKREGSIATLYWDATGVVKAVFNMNISFEVVQAFQSSGANLARSVGAECVRYLHQSDVSDFLSGAAWGTQLGSHWRNILQRPHGVSTVSILIVLDRLYSNPKYFSLVLRELDRWFSQGGNLVTTLQVENAMIAGNAEGFLTEERPIVEEQSAGDYQFCQSPIQNSPFTFTGGPLDGLLRPLIRCEPSAL